jgi:hypothetical protein
VTVAVEVGGRDGDRARAGRDDGGREASVAVAQQDRDVVRREARDGEVAVAVAVQIARRDRDRLVTDGDRGRRRRDQVAARGPGEQSGERKRSKCKGREGRRAAD